MSGRVNKVIETVIEKAIESRVRSRLGDAVSCRTRTQASVYDESIPKQFCFRRPRSHARDGLGELRRPAGRTVPEFLRDPDHPNPRVKLLFPEVQPSSFAVTVDTVGSVERRRLESKA